MSTTNASVPAADIISRKGQADEEFDQAVRAIVDEALRAVDLLDQDGNVDQEDLVQRVYDAVKTKRVVEFGKDRDDRRHPETSTTKDELAAAIFTAGPTYADAEKDEFHKAAYAKCASMVWNLTQEGKRGKIQQRLEADKLVLIRGKVFRNTNPIKDGLYVSTEEEIVLREFWAPRLDKWRKLADTMEDDFNMVTARVQELDGPMRTAIESALQEVAAKLPTSLPSGNNGQKALDK